MAEEFDFTALLSGVRERRPPPESASLPIIEERPVVVDRTPVDIPAPPTPMAPSVLADQAAELRAIWNPEKPSVEEPIHAPPAPWERAKPERSFTPRVITQAAGRYDYERDSWRKPPYWQGVLNRASICGVVVLIGLMMGALAAPIIRTKTHYVVTDRASAESHRSISDLRTARATSAKSPERSDQKQPSEAVRRPQARRNLHILIPLSALVLVAAIWIAGLPLILGPLQKPGFLLLVLVALLSAGWNGTNSVLTLLEDREQSDRLKEDNRPKSSQAPPPATSRPK